MHPQPSFSLESEVRQLCLYPSKWLQEETKLIPHPCISIHRPISVNAKPFHFNHFEKGSQRVRMAIDEPMRRREHNMDRNHSKPASRFQPEHSWSSRYVARIIFR